MKAIIYECGEFEKHEHVSIPWMGVLKWKHCRHCSHGHRTEEALNVGCSSNSLQELVWKSLPHHPLYDWSPITRFLMNSYYKEKQLYGQKLLVGSNGSQILEFYWSSHASTELLQEQNLQAPQDYADLQAFSANIQQKPSKHALNTLSLN